MKQQADLNYVIFGEGPLLNALQEEIAAVGLQDRIHFLGWRPDARSLMAGFDVLLAPSLWEGFGLVMLEAMAARIPIITSRASALPEIVIDGQTGYPLPPADSNAAAHRLWNIFSALH